MFDHTSAEHKDQASENNPYSPDQMLPVLPIRERLVWGASGQCPVSPKDTANCVIS